MTSERRDAWLLSLLLLAAAAGAWCFFLRAPLQVDAAPLAALPAQLGAWRAEPYPLDSAVERILTADFNVTREYRHPVGERIWLYVGYFGTERGGWPEHTPWICYPGQGWQIVQQGVRELEPGGLAVNELVVEQTGERRLVYFWYRSHRRTGMLGLWDHGLDRLIGHLAHGRADGALVRVSTPTDEVEPARGRLTRFALQLDRQLAGHWPREAP